MLSQPELPDYVSISPNERGSSLNLSFACYRQLARTSLAITKNIPDSLMAVYKLPEQRGCVVEIFLSAGCLSIAVDSSAETLGLFVSGLDLPADPVCLFERTTSQPADWSELRETALAHRP